MASDGLFYKSDNATSEIDALTNNVKQMHSSLEEIGNLLKNIQGDWAGEEAEKSISSFNEKKEALSTTLERTESHLTALKNVYTSFDEARTGL